MNRSLIRVQTTLVCTAIVIVMALSMLAAPLRAATAEQPSPSPSPTTNMLNGNPNGADWLQKFNRVPKPEATAAGMSMPVDMMHGSMMKPMGPMPPNHPMPPRCRTMMLAYMRTHTTITYAQHARMRAKCMTLMHGHM